MSNEKVFGIRFEKALDFQIQDVINNFYNTHKFKDNKVQVGIGVIDNFVCNEIGQHFLTVHYSGDNDYYNECAVWENIFDVFPYQNSVLARNLQDKFPALHCNEVFGNYFEK